MLTLLYITNKIDVAKLADSCGVDRIFVDLEILGKEKRQAGMNSVISRHAMEDVSAVRGCLIKSELLVRVDPINDNSKAQINEVISRGAQYVMLPMFKNKEEVEKFIDYIDGRAKSILLFETPESLVRMDDILSVGGIDEVHIGLNDLHLGMNLDFMFELLSGGIVEYMCNKFKKSGIKYGFGGIARLGLGLIPAEMVIAEHYRLNSSMAILSRSFCDANQYPIEIIENDFRTGIDRIREYEKILPFKSEPFFIENQQRLKDKVEVIVSNMNRKR